jgi:hypothetical protein
MDKDWESLFHNIVEGIDIDAQTEAEEELEEVDVWQLNRAIVGMNEAATYLGRHLMQCMTEEDNEALSKGLPKLLNDLIAITELLSEMLSDCDCEDCSWDEES